MRYEVRPSQVLPGTWTVLDTEHARLARRTSGRAAIFPFRNQAETMCNRLNRDLERKVICKLCRHKVPANEVQAGWCQNCREDGPDVA